MTKMEKPRLTREQAVTRFLAQLPAMDHKELRQHWRELFDRELGVLKTRAHVFSKVFVLCAVRFIDHHDDVAAGREQGIRVALIPSKFLNEGENKPLVLAEKLPHFLAVFGLRSLSLGDGTRGVSCHYYPVFNFGKPKTPGQWIAHIAGAVMTLFLVCWMLWAYVL